MRLPVAVALFALAGAPGLHAPLGAQATVLVRGVVRDPGGQPVPRAEAYIMGDSANATTNEGGAFALTTVGHRHVTLRVRRLGFTAYVRGVDLPDTGSVSVAVTLTPLAQSMASVRVVARRGGVTGTVRDPRGAPLPSVKVELLGGAVEPAITDSLGQFFLPAKKKGSFFLVARKSGYGFAQVSMPFNPDSATEADIVLFPVDANNRDDGLGRTAFILSETSTRIAMGTSSAAVVSRDELSTRGSESLGQALCGTTLTRKNPRLGADPTLGCAKAGCILVNGDHWSTLPPDQFNADEVEAVEFYPRGADWSATLKTRDAHCDNKRVSVLVVWLRRDLPAAGAVASAQTPLASQAPPPAAAALSQALPATETVTQSMPGLITARGAVFDSIAGKPIAGANVQLSGIDSEIATRRFSGQSGSDGRFAIVNVAPGHYLAGFFDPALDTLGMEIRARVVDIEGPLQNIKLATPSARTIARAICGAASNGGGQGLLMGHLHDAENGQEIVAGSVLVTWSEAQGQGDSAASAGRSMVLTTHAAGGFTACGLPNDKMLNVRAVRGADSSGWVSLRIPPDSLRHVTLSVGHAVGAAHSRLVGHVYGATHQPIATARAAVAGTSREATVDSAGAYSFDGLPAGTQTMVVRAIGYAPREVVVQLAAERLNVMDVVLERPVVLPAVITTETRHLQTFEDHKKKSVGGYFVYPTHIEGYPAMQEVGQLIMGLPGVRVLKVGSDWSLAFRPANANTGGCTPLLLVDGKKSDMSFSDLNYYVQPDEIVGVEVYTNPDYAPGEYPRGSAVKPCGIVAVWTKSGQP